MARRIIINHTFIGEESTSVAEAMRRSREKGGHQVMVEAANRDAERVKAREAKLAAKRAAG